MRPVDRRRGATSLTPRTRAIRAAVSACSESFPQSTEDDAGPTNAEQLEGAPHETLLTIDATTGQNGLRQAKLFAEAVEIDGIVLTKLDGTAKGGIALAIARELGLPVKLIGIGETLEDLRPFDARDFASALIAES